VMPFLVAAPLLNPLCWSVSSARFTVLDDAAVLKDTVHGDQLLNLGAPENDMSPFFVASLLCRLCPPPPPVVSDSPYSDSSSSRSSRGIVIAPFDTYGILAAGSALACHDFVGLVPLFPNKEVGDESGVGPATTAYIIDFLREQGIVPRMGRTLLQGEAFYSSSSMLSVAAHGQHHGGVSGQEGGGGHLPIVPCL